MSAPRSQHVGTFLQALIIVAAMAALASFANAATVPSGFTDLTVAAGVKHTTTSGPDPDRRIFVCEQGGTLRVIKNGALLATPFLTVTVNSSGERGLLGVAFDPNFT